MELKTEPLASGKLGEKGTEKMGRWVAENPAGIFSKRASFFLFFPWYCFCINIIKTKVKCT